MDSISNLRRSTTDPKVSGLAAGLARAWNVDPVLVRVGFVILGLSGGIGIILYLAGWLMVPLEGRDTSYLDDAIPQTRSWSVGVKIAIVAVACVIGAAALSWLMPFSMTAALVFAAIWYFGYYRNRPNEQRSRPRKNAPESPKPEQPAGLTPDDPERTRFIEFTEKSPFTEAAENWQQRILEHLDAVRASTEQTTGPSAAPAPPAGRSPMAPPTADDPQRRSYFAHPDPVGLYVEEQPAARPVAPLIDPQIARRKRRARKLTLLSLILVGLACTGLGVASAAGVAIATGTYLAVTLLILGLTLLVGTVVGRPPGVSFLAILVALSMLATLIAGPYVSQASARSVSYTNATLPAGDQLDVGQLTVDLRQINSSSMPLPSTEAPTRVYHASVETGRLEVFLPQGTSTQVEGTVGAGILQLPNTEARTGQQLTFNWPPDKGESRLTVQLHVGRGQLEVHR